MTIITSTDRERQRFEHLVLGRPRPKAPAKRRTRRTKAPAELAPGIEQRVQIRERWSHKQGTPETHEHYDQASRRPGSLARLHASGAIHDDQLAAADQIATAYWTIARDVTVRTASLETRIDGGRHGRAEEERFGAVLADLSYDCWRRAVGRDGEALLAVIAHDVALTVVAHRMGMGMARARRRLTEVLDLWWTVRGANRPLAKKIVAAA